MEEKEQNFTREKFTAEDYKRLIENTKVRCAELRLLDDDFDIEKYTIEECEKALEFISKQMRSRILLPRQTIFVSTAWQKNDFLTSFRNSNSKDHIVDSFNYGIVTFWNFDTHYKILKRRLTHERRRSIKKPILH